MGGNLLLNDQLPGNTLTGVPGFAGRVFSRFLAFGLNMLGAPSSDSGEVNTGVRLRRSRAVLQKSLPR